MMGGSHPYLIDKFLARTRTIRFFSALTYKMLILIHEFLIFYKKSTVSF